MKRAVVIASALAASACSTLDPGSLPPLGEAIVVVDTDLPTPSIAGRLRADFYGEDGAWIDSRDVARLGASAWPASFSVYTDDETHDKSVWVRLRVYPEGRTRDYLGERFADWGEPKPGAAPDLAPRLVRDGRDETPADEPEPLVTVDRLLLLHLRYGVRGRVRVLLSGDCAGTMVNLDAKESCVDTERARVPVTEEAMEDDLSIPTATAAGTWGAEPCPEVPAGERVCVPGSGAILGSEDLLIYSDLAPVPERVVRLSRFWIDRDEVSVGTYRAALAAGYKPTTPPTANDGALGTVVGNTTCTWSTQAMGREDYGLSCITWESARELCQHLGGDLPSEAQWEYLASSAGRAARTRFPWGDDPPSCDRAVYGRVALGGFPGVCESAGKGPQPLALADADALGMRGLGGGLAEWARDTSSDYGGKCWQASRNVDPGCYEPSQLKSVRGGSWAAPPATLRSATRLGSFDGGSAFEGFRCAYPEAGP